MEDLVKVGTAIMVHPDLTHDPINMQGHLGTISHLLYEDCAAYVRFQNQMIGLYSTDALMMLVPLEIVFDKLRSDVYEMDMDASEVLDIMEMYQLHAKGTPECQKEALDWAMTHDKISRAIVFSVEDWIDFQIDRLDRQQRPGQGI